MIRDSGGTRLTLFLILCMEVGGCPSLFQTGYGGDVIAKISLEALNTVRLAIRGLPDLKGPKDVKTGNPDCDYYDKRLTRSGVLVGVSACYYGRARDSHSEGQYYRVGVTTGISEAGRRPEVRAEIHELLEQIRKTLELYVAPEKITIRAEPEFIL